VKKATITTRDDFREPHRAVRCAIQGRTVLRLFFLKAKIMVVSVSNMLLSPLATLSQSVSRLYIATP
jgi:hypothetical protein